MTGSNSKLIIFLKKSDCFWPKNKIIISTPSIYYLSQARHLKFDIKNNF